MDLPGREIESILKRMGRTLRHRGPDEYSQLALPELGCGLSCSRLSIVDLTSGKQPLANENGTIYAVMNGEIYNHRELRDELEQHGHGFRTRSDTEVLVHLFEEEGPDCLSRLSGMFALAILDLRRRRLLLARDRAGMKPLYYAQNKAGALFFASEIKALLAGGQPAEPDFRGMDTFLSLGYVPAPRTCFRGVHKLAAGHCLLVDEKGLRSRCYWRFTFHRDASPGTDRDYAEKLQSRLDRAVRSHLQADVPVGVLISGGIDSSLVAAAAARAGGRLKTFSVVFPEAPEMDERRYQQALVQEFGFEHHEVEFRWRDIPRFLPRAIFHQDVPSLAFPSVVQYRLAELASSSVKTVLSGEGADELFAGYAWYGGAPYNGLRKIVPPGLIRPLGEAVTHVRLGRLLRFLAAPDGAAADAEVARIFTRREKRALFDVDSTPEGDLDCLRLHPETEASCRNGLQRRLAVGITKTLCDGLLMVNDRIAMAHSLEIRMPFLDNSIIDLARHLPPDLTRRKGQEKYILSLLKEQLPPLLANRKKHFLQAPVRLYYRGPLREWARAVLLDAPAGGPLNRRLIEKRFHAWLDGSDPYVRRVRALVALQLWWNQFFGRA